MKPSLALNKVDLALLGVAVLWGFNMPAMKYGMGHMPPLAFNWLRFLLSVPAAWLMLLGSGAQAKPITREDWKELVKVGFAFFAFIWFFTLGLSRTTAGNTAILMGLLPLGVALWSRILGTESISKRLAAGIFISLAGALIIVFGSGKEVSLRGQHITGNLLILLGVLANGYFMAGCKPLTAKHAPQRVATFCFTIAFAFLTLVSLPSLGQVHWHALRGIDYFCIFYCGPMALTLTNFLWIWGVSKIGSTRTSVYNNLPPIFAILGGVAFLGEHFGMAMLVGSLIIFSGVYICRTAKAALERSAA